MDNNAVCRDPVDSCSMAVKNWRVLQDTTHRLGLKGKHIFCIVEGIDDDFSGA